ncbi:sigma-70 family RNA polymerase sigma factor [Kribbella sp. NBC_00382]|uniref:sigma-70 family RNA polymerase sigma factor n=1 Tax=Kribbella sp. NBC_00382 TaxID=2975967 RepID=UPI002E23D882
MDGSQTSAWDEIVRTHSARVYHFAYRLTGNRYDAEDLSHDVFVRVFRYLHTYRPNTFEGWLYRITVNLFFDQIRHRRRIRFGELSSDLDGRLPTREPGPAQTFAARSLDHDVQTALGKLDPRLRAAVVLRDIEAFSYKEIAALLGVEVGTVGSRVHRGRAHLRVSLAHRAPCHKATAGADISSGGPLAPISLEEP